MTRLTRRALFALPVVLPAAAAKVEAATKWRSTGGVSGWVIYDLERPRPYVIGRVFNMPAAPARPCQLIYQISSEPLGAVYGVRDGGEPLACPVAGADYPTLASLRDASIKSGEYATCLREGLVRLGDPPGHAITADVYGIKWDAVRGEQ